MLLLRNTYILDGVNLSLNFVGQKLYVRYNMARSEKSIVLCTYFYN